MIKKTSALSLTAALLYTTVAPAVPAVAADMEAPASVAVPAARLAPQGEALPAMPASSISGAPEMTAVPGMASVDAAAAEAQGASVQASQAAEAAPAASQRPIFRSVAPQGETKDAPVSLFGRLTAAVRAKLSGASLFDASRRISPAAVGVMGLRPLPAPALPKGVRLDQPPTIPAPIQRFNVSKFTGISIPLNIAPISESMIERVLRTQIDNDKTLGVKSADLKTVHVKFVKGLGEQADTYFASFQQTQDGLAVDGGRLTFMVKIINGMAEVVDVDAHLYPALKADTAAKLNDDELKQKAEEKLALPQTENPDYTLLGRKICYVGSKWRAVNVYAVRNVKEARGIMVAVDVATGETFAWDARHGMTSTEAAATQTTGRMVVLIKGQPSTEQIAEVKAALERAGATVLDSVMGKTLRAFLVAGDPAAIQKAVAQFSDVIAEPEVTRHLAGAQAVAARGAVHSTAENKDHRPNNVPELVEQAMPYINVNVAGEKVQADTDGKFTASKDGAFSATLDGKWATIIDENNNPVKIVGTVTAGQPNVIVAKASPNDLLTLNQLNMFIWIHRIHDWWSTRLGGDTRIDQQIPVHVNIDQDCNAYYTPGTPSLNFFKESDRCSDTGRPGVGAHEFGHFVDDMIGGIVNGGMSEGWGDIGSMFLLGTPIIGEGFLKNQNPSWIRNGENNYQYNENDEVHAQGQAWMGFAWKLRQALRAKLGEAEGQAAVEALIIPTMFNKANDIPGQMAKVLLNATKKDGTVLHEAEIRAAAKAHGITLPGDKSGFGPQALQTAVPSVSFKIDASVERGSRTLRVLTLKSGDAAALKLAKKAAYTALSLAHIDFRDLKWSARGGPGEITFELTGSKRAVEYMTRQIERLTAATPIGVAQN